MTRGNPRSTPAVNAGNNDFQYQSGREGSDVWLTLNEDLSHSLCRYEERLLLTTHASHRGLDLVVVVGRVLEAIIEIQEHVGAFRRDAWDVLRDTVLLQNMLYLRKHGRNAIVDLIAQIQLLIM